MITLKPFWSHYLAILACAWIGLGSALPVAAQMHAHTAWPPEGPPPGGYGPAATCPDGCPYPSGGPGGHHHGGIAPATYTELLPEDRGLFYGPDERWHGRIGAAFEDAYIRFDYLNWSIQEPGDILLGAPRLSGSERQGFVAIDDQGNVFDRAFVPNLSQTDFSRIDGIRATLGVPFEDGTWEFNVWALEEADFTIQAQRQTIRLNQLLTITRIPVTTLFINGAANDTVEIFYDDYNATVSSQVFGTEANYIFEPFTPNQPVSMRPMLGFRYVSLREDMRIGGSFTIPADPLDPLDTDTVLNHRIRSQSRNNLFGPSAGLRTHWTLGRVSFGVEPKLTLGFNRIDEEVRAEEIFAQNTGELGGELPFQSSGHDTDFMAIFEIATYVRVRLHEHFNIFCGYNYIHLSDVSRPFENVLYNAASPTTADFDRRVEHRQSVHIDGLVVGGEIFF